MLTREEALRLAGETLQTDGPVRDRVADLILEVQRQTAEKCAEIVRDGEVVESGSGFMRYESGRLTLGAALREIEKAFTLEPRP